MAEKKKKTTGKKAAPTKGKKGEISMDDLKKVSGGLARTARSKKGY